MQLYERVEKFARQTDGMVHMFFPPCWEYHLLTGCCLGGAIGQVYSPELRSEFHALETMLQRFHGMLPSLLDNVGLERFEVLSLINPHLVIAHTTYHGSMLLLYSIDIREVDDGDDDDDSVRTRTRSRAQARAFEAARSLAETFAQIRGAKGIQKIRGFILPMVRYLYHLKHMENTHRHFLSISLLLDARFERCSRIRKTYKIFFHPCPSPTAKDNEERQRTWKSGEVCDMLSISSDFMGLYI